jgi:hypothetical protein
MPSKFVSPYKNVFDSSMIAPRHVVAGGRMSYLAVARIRRLTSELLVVDVGSATQCKIVDVGVASHPVEHQHNLAHQVDEDIQVAYVDRILHNSEEILRWIRDGLAVNANFGVGVTVRLGHQDIKTERRQLACRRWLDIGFQAVSELSGEVHVKSGDIAD